MHRNGGSELSLQGRGLSWSGLSFCICTPGFASPRLSVPCPWRLLLFFPTWERDGSKKLPDSSAPNPLPSLPSQAACWVPQLTVKAKGLLPG